MGFIKREVWVNYLGDNDDMFKMIARSFIESYEMFDKKLLEIYNNGDLESCLNEIHSLKGITLNLGMDELYTLTAKACDSIRKEKFSEEELLNLIQIFNSTYNELKTIVS